MTDLEPIRALYAGSLERHGATPRGVGWPDADGQRRRFAQLARVLDGDPGPLTVADLGCGYGALFGALADRLGARLTGYTGYDLSPEMLAAARTAVTDPRAAWALADHVAAPADYVVASGIFNVRLGAGEVEWLAHVDATIDAMWARARRGIACNCLTVDVDWRDDALFYADPGRFLERARRRLSPAVALAQDYGLYEWTLTVRRRSRS